MLQRHGTLKLTFFGAMIGLLCMAVWIEILNRWHMSQPLYGIYAGLMGMGAVYGAAGTVAICGPLKLLGSVRARFHKG